MKCSPKIEDSRRYAPDVSKSERILGDPFVLLDNHEKLDLVVSNVGGRKVSVKGTAAPNRSAASATSTTRKIAMASRRLASNPTDCRAVCGKGKINEGMRTLLTDAGPCDP